MLEIGCGWGALAESATTEFGAHITGVTLSTEQLAFAQARMKWHGVEQQVDLRLQDYRDIHDGPYDAICSIEMIEAVGQEYWSTFFEHLSPQRVSQLHTLYDVQATFKDPFNEVQGLTEIERIFRHMYVALEQPHFVVTDHVVDGSQAFLTWEFCFRFKRFDTTTLQAVRGTSHVQFNDQGLVMMHCDYWDAAEELYEKLPVVGG